MMSEILALAVPNVDAFAQEVGVSRTTLYLWRSGKRNPSPANLARLADVLDRRGGELRELAQELRRGGG